jgi:hypothetical protein
VTVDNISTPSTQAKRSGQTKKISVTPGPIKKTPGTPGIIMKISHTPGTINKMPGTTGHTKKITGSAGPIKKVSGIEGATKKISGIPGPSSSMTQIQTSTSDDSLISGRDETPLLYGRKMSVPSSKTKKKPSPQPTNRFVSPRCVRNPQKLVVVPSGGAPDHTPSRAGTNISTGSSSSASSASSTKARKLINAVRRVSRISSSGGTPTSKSLQREND